MKDLTSHVKESVLDPEDHGSCYHTCVSEMFLWLEGETKDCVIFFFLKMQPSEAMEINIETIKKTIRNSTGPS